MRNIALLEATLAKIQDHPELHDQSLVFQRNECGTAACFMGWACMLAGYTPVLTGSFFGPHTTGSVVADARGRRHIALLTAYDLLGLTTDEGAKLAAPYNTVRQLELMVKALVNGEELGHPDEYKD
ncbi:hypothetical protein DQP57_00480 [Mycobacterium colombiense]|uniref:Uncharacterized protein n=1 Tax=Mycobacterium colombiense TaxID=339268 RepID=A0A329MBT1_9MYCO|nr:hypothetical protein [Mycobacterium colombiense]RAV17535.1 hypothetical protein DQP57_00480 [Mycobacterium colombiense]